MTDKEYDNITLIAAATLASPPRPDASAEPRFTLDEIEAAMDRVLERYGFHAAPPDASAGLIEAASSVCFHYLCCDGECNEARPSLLHLAALIGFESDPITNEEIQTARAADRSGK